MEINDLSPTGAQPFADIDDKIHAVVNGSAIYLIYLSCNTYRTTGEIYDYDRLRAEMIEKQNYAFKGRSDCELVLALCVHAT